MKIYGSRYQKHSNFNFVESVIDLCSSLVNLAISGHEYIDEFKSNLPPEEELFKVGLKPEDVFSLLNTELTILQTLFVSDLFKDLVQAALDNPSFKLQRPNMSQEDGRQELYEDLTALKGFGETFTELYKRVLPLYEELEKTTNKFPTYIDIPALLRDLRVAGEVFELQALVVLQGLKGEWQRIEKSKKSINEMYF